jgi:menaquinone-dependent protoporphyrinogen oxidase
MRALVAYGSKRGGTAGLAEMIGDALSAHGIETDVRPADEVTSIDPYAAVVVAGALYMSRWHRDARRFVRRHAQALRDRPVWLVSSGPLDDSAAAGQLPSVPMVARLAAMVGARGMQTFGGRLTPDATGFPARAMAKTRAGDWRDSRIVDRFAADVAAEMRRWAEPGQLALAPTDTGPSDD